MKKRQIFLVILAVVLVLGIVGCNSDSKDGLPKSKGKLIVTDIPASLNNTYIFMTGVLGANEYGIVGLTDLEGTTNNPTFVLPKISGGKVTIPLYAMNPGAKTLSDLFDAYSGNDTTELGFVVFNKQKLALNEAASMTGMMAIGMMDGAKFTNGNLTKKWTEFFVLGL